MLITTGHELVHVQTAQLGKDWANVYGSVCMYLRREAAEEAEPEVHHGEGEVLVEEVAKKTAHAQVGPAAVHQ